MSEPFWRVNCLATISNRPPLPELEVAAIILLLSERVILSATLTSVTPPLPAPAVFEVIWAPSMRDNCLVSKTILPPLPASLLLPFVSVAI